MNPDDEISSESHPETEAGTYVEPILQPGVQLGSYIIVEKIGQGGMCEVYRAHDPGLNRYVAIKIMLTHLETQEEISNFFEEGRIVAKFNHSHIVPIYSVGVEQGLPWIAMAFIEGQNLADYILDGNEFNLEHAKAFLFQAISALEYASRFNVIHLDIKPANFILDPQGQVLLADFGLAKRVENVKEGQPAKGTPAYASPEQFLRGKLDHRTDIYALGVTLFHLATKKLPYPGATAQEICSMHLRSPFPMNILVDEQIPEGWQNLISKMAEKKPKDRFQSYEELRKALESVERFRYVRTNVETLDYGDESRRSYPLSGGNKEDLFYMIPAEAMAKADQVFKVGPAYSEKDVLNAIGTRHKMMRLNRIAEKCIYNGTTSDTAMDEVLLAIAKVSGYRESLLRVTAFMSEQSGQSPQTDREIFEFIGIERAHRLAQIGFGLTCRWQGEVLLNHHNFWEQSIYAGLISEFMAEMLGYPLTGYEFVCGLFHNIGRLVLMELYPAKVVGLWLSSLEDGKKLDELELQTLGLTSSKAGAFWLKLNKFDPLIYFVVANHLTPQNCYKSLMTLGSGGLLQKRFHDEKSVQCLAFLTACSASLVKELGLGYGGCSVLDATPWDQQKATKLVFMNRPNKDVTIEDFCDFFLQSCRNLPELPMLRLATAEAAHQRAMHSDATWIPNHGVATH